MNSSKRNTTDSNLLPKDGTVIYLGKIFSDEEADFHFNTLFNTIHWKNDEVMLFGKKIITKRKVAWYGDREFEYTYSKIRRKAKIWTPELIFLKEQIEAKSGETFNSCLLNLYHSGAEGMGWHSDAESDLKKNAAIVSISFGAQRKFAFKHKKTKETISLTLENGSALIMKGITQKYWLHRLPPTKKVPGARINLTFRTIDEAKHKPVSLHK
ncbi:alpha-ketoglutarate-dependent dioxygenase AlkB [Aequorivita sp. SDUM287046]|uniref:Alpha-ketoglutarate-dependent dioxygenase AlkB n=1 Tax=Aequorivita aurantiaca TaxID=3053356 RepID=A0ABT8DFE6_9FLAO|nr:alpha-ketoglutarate-dependent dioxygenase AlkB [Aequorivita aurantiaca]MDN3723522.1 alpha-ketoglutarate-dependent dioxygenase AlkB [Aequorivita aurantiaca]